MCFASKKSPPESERKTPVERTSPTKRIRFSNPPSTVSKRSSLSNLEMEKLTGDKKGKVQSFMAVTESSKNVAIQALDVAGWNVDFAVELYITNPAAFKSKNDSDVQIINEYQADDRTILNEFSKYANDPNDDLNPDKIGPNGLMRLLKDMSIDPLDRRVLILACKLKAQTQCEFTKEEWTTGFKALGVNDVKSLRNKLEELDSKVQERETFTELYKFVFDYGKQAGQKFMQLDYALQYWKILFKDLFPLLNLWEEFLQTEHGKGITKDTWVLLLEFCFTINPDLTNYDPDGAWPVLLDQFVEYARCKQTLTAA